MENLNDLIWTDEDDNEGYNVQSEPGPMKELCLRGFCTVGDHFSCAQDAPQRTAACVFIP